MHYHLREEKYSTRKRWWCAVLVATAFAPAWLTPAAAQSSKSNGQPVSSTVLANKAVQEGDRLSREWTRASLQAAVRKYREARGLWLLSKEPQREAEVLEKLGNTLAVLSDYRDAIDSYSEALRVATADERLQVRILKSLSDAYLEMANVEKATPFCNQVQAISHRIQYEGGMADALNCLGVAESISGDVLEAQKRFETALPIWQSEKSERGLASTELNLGYLHANLGNMELALDYYQRALAVWQATGDRQKQALTLTAMAGVYALSGEKQKALNLHSEALKSFQMIGNRNGEAATLNGIGYLYDDLGERGDALKAYTRALRLYESIGNPHYAAITLGYIGRVYFALGDKGKALDFYNQKLTTSRAVHNRRMESYTLKDIGNVRNSLQEYDTALDCYRQALTLSQEVLDRRGEAFIVLSIGSTYDQQGRKTEALSYYRQALTLMQAVADRRGEVLTLYAIAGVERDLGQLNKARQDIEKSIDLIESLRVKVLSPSLRISYLDTVYKHYEFYVDLLMRMHQQDPHSGYQTLALEVNDHARAKTLLENLIMARTEIHKDVDPTLLAEERQLQQRLNQKAEQQTRLLAGKSTPEQSAAIKKEVETLLSQFQEVEATVRDKNPKYAALTQPQLLKLSDMQKLLDADSVLLEYALGEERSYVWAVTPTSVMSFELPGRREIETLAQHFYNVVAASTGPRRNETAAEQKTRNAQSAAAYLTLAAKLSKILIEPVAPYLGQKRLLIVADGVLQYIPFSTLPQPGKPDSDSLARPLLIDHEVITLPSLSTLAALREEVRDRTPTSKAIAVFADPVFELDDPRFKRARRTPSLRQPADASNDRTRHNLQERAAADLETTDERVVFDRLPFSAQEAMAILEIASKLETKMALGFDANLTTALDPELRQYRVIHFATHALLNNSHPELSGVVLSLLDRSGNPRDGFLRLNEIYNMDLPAELVVLSACQTALGREVRGEGLIGLTRGFMYAGVPRVIASLWRINDRAAAELMRYFYEALLWQHLPPAQALRIAQIKMWETAEWRFPHYWAAFVLQGEWK
jgi:CHAT domain-containing protein